MEDGEYRGVNVNSAILVFAGGTSESFSAFSRKDRSKDDPDYASFVKSKGPDFVSRLRGHLEIVGINPREKQDEKPDELFLVRRAITLRSLLESIQDLRPDEAARIDDNLLHALLHVSEYRHGTRSMRNLLGLFANRSHRLMQSYLPPLAQLDMHVVGTEFLKLLDDPPDFSRTRTIVTN
jgi:hypothetical protein